MTDRAIASRPSLEQVIAIVNFMENHTALAQGQLRGLDGRVKSKKLWCKLTRIVNKLEGPTRPMKSWIKYWADKKSTVRAKVLSGGGDPNVLCSNIEKRMWDLFLANDNKGRNAVKVESHYMEEPFFNEESNDGNNDTNNDGHVAEGAPDNHEEPALAFDEPASDVDERQMVVMEKLLKVMGQQATAMSQLAHAANVNSQAMERLAEASQIQARAIERLAATFESIGASTHDVRTAIVDIDSTMKRFYSTSPT